MGCTLRLAGPPLIKLPAKAAARMTFTSVGARSRYKFPPLGLRVDAYPARTGARRMGCRMGRDFAMLVAAAPLPLRQIGCAAGPRDRRRASAIWN